MQSEWVKHKYKMEILTYLVVFFVLFPIIPNRIG